MTNRRDVCGWDLPPGVTQRMIDDSVGGDDPTEDISDLERSITMIEGEIKELNETMEKLKNKLTKLIEEYGQ